MFLCFRFVSPVIMCVKVLLCVCVCVCSLLAQVSGHITAFEALEVIQALGQPLGGLAVGSAAIGQSVCAAALQTLQTAQITIF